MLAYSTSSHYAAAAAAAAAAVVMSTSSVNHKMLPTSLYKYTAYTDHNTFILLV